MSGRFLTALLAAGALCCLLVSGAHSQGRCAPREEIVRVLAQKYHEQARAAGSIQNGMVLMEVYVSEKGTWTILMTDPQGIACILAAGQAWDELPLPPKGRPS